MAQSLGMSRVRVGIDLVQISRIAKALEAFGERFIRRVFTDDEAAYARSGQPPYGALLTAPRLATRFAAKEAVKKALGLDGVGWRDLEVTRRDSGACDLVLHGAARAAADALGARDHALSMSRDGDYATAIVIAQVGDV